MLEDGWPSLPVLYTTMRTIGNPLDMVVSRESDRKKCQESGYVTRPSLRLTALSLLDLFPHVPQTSCPSFKKPTFISKMLLSSLFLILAACAVGFTTATPHSLARRSYHNAVQPFQKRASGQFTYFTVGMGACGQQNTDNDFVSTLLLFAVWSLNPVCNRLLR